MAGEVQGEERNSQIREKVDIIVDERVEKGGRREGEIGKRGEGDRKNNLPNFQRYVGNFMSHCDQVSTILNLWTKLERLGRYM